MGLFDRFKDAFTGATGAAGSPTAGAGGDWAAQAQAAQQLAAEQMRQSGYSDGSLPTMAYAAQFTAHAQADHDVLNAYGQELRRVAETGIPGSGVITGSTDTGERTAGNAWFVIEAQITLPNQAPYAVTKRELVPAPTLGNYQVGSTHEVRVDPADPQNIVFTS